MDVFSGQRKGQKSTHSPISNDGRERLAPRVVYENTASSRVGEGRKIAFNTAKSNLARGSLRKQSGMYTFIACARVVEISLSVTSMPPLILLILTVNKAKIIHPLLRYFLILYIISLVGSCAINIAAAILSSILEVPSRLRSLRFTVGFSPTSAKDWCQMIACSFSLIAHLAFTVCSIERFASTRTPDRYYLRFRSRETALVTVSIFVPVTVICLLSLYLRQSDIVFISIAAALFTISLVLFFFHLCAASKMRAYPQIISKKFQVRQNIKVHNFFIRLSKYVLCLTSGILIILFWSVVVTRNAEIAPSYEAIYFVGYAFLTLFIVYLLLTEQVLQPALRTFMLSRWLIRKSAPRVINKLSVTSLSFTPNAPEHWTVK